VIHLKPIDEFIEQNWEKVAASGPATHFWRGKKEAAVFGHIRDGELLDYEERALDSEEAEK
jgi:hypothetical protein